MCQEPFQQHQRLLLGDTHWQRLHIEDQEVEGEGQDDCPQQPDVDPGRHPEQGLVLRQAAGQEQCRIKTSSTRTPEIPSKGRFKYKRNHKELHLRVGDGPCNHVTVTVFQTNLAFAHILS